jgi:hypothetical protein
MPTLDNFSASFRFSGGRLLKFGGGALRVEPEPWPVFSGCDGSSEQLFAGTASGLFGQGSSSGGLGVFSFWQLCLSLQKLSL